MHWFLDPIQKQYADFTGRATRREFWMFYLWYFIILMPLSIFTGILMAVSTGVGIVLVGVLLVVSLALVVPTIALAARRLHDIGMTGWLQLLGFIPYIGGLILLVLYCLPSKAGTNKYGPNKYGVETTPVAPVASQTAVAQEVPPVAPAQE